MGMIQLLQAVIASFAPGQVPHPLRQQLLGYAVGQAKKTAPLLPGLFFHQTFRADGPIPRDSAAKAL